MNIVKSIFPSSKEYIEKLVKQCDKAILICPELCLQVSKTKGHFYFRVKDLSRGTCKYISQSDPNFLSLVRKYCAMRILNAIKPFLHPGKIPENKAFDALDKISVWLEDRFNDAVPGFVRSRRTILREWQAVEYERNTFPISADRASETARGEIVRSKTENYIADYFYNNHIPYRLEYPIDVGTHTIYPDFVFVNPANGNIYYLEAFGLMHNREYVYKSFLCKIRDYSRVGIVLGVNLLATFESEDLPFDPVGFRRMIEGVFSS